MNEWASEAARLAVENGELRSALRRVLDTAERGELDPMTITEARALIGEHRWTNRSTPSGSSRS